MPIGVEDGPVCAEYHDGVASEVGDDRQMSDGFAQEYDDERPADAAEVKRQETAGQQQFVQPHGLGQQPHGRTQWQKSRIEVFVAGGVGKEVPPFEPGADVKKRQGHKGCSHIIGQNDTLLGQQPAPRRPAPTRRCRVATI